MNILNFVGPILLIGVFFSFVCWILKKLGVLKNDAIIALSEFVFMVCCVLLFFVYIIETPSRIEVTEKEIGAAQASEEQLSEIGSSLVNEKEEPLYILHTKTNDQDFYEYLSKTDDGGYERKKIPVEDCVIYEIDNQEIPRIEEWGTETIRTYSPILQYYIFFPIRRSAEADTQTETFVSAKNQEYKVYVPKSSIINSFTS